MAQWRMAAVAGLCKLLLAPSYRSSDFEVHRNWLAVTHSLPPARWYHEATSPWTLDYPPLFAWCEWALSKVASVADARMLDVASLNYASEETLLFMRFSVVASEIIFYVGAIRLLDALKIKSLDFQILLGLVFLNPGILFVDHIHFQYNAFLYGIQLFSIALMFEQRHILGAIAFATLLNLKHIYLYQAPAYFIFLLSGFCFTANRRFSFTRLASLGIAVIAVFAISFGPFVNHLPQILTRLFPFKRGLCHAYWAPNFWAIYSFTDRVLLKMVSSGIVTGASTWIDPQSTASLTRGIVGDSSFAVIPTITPIHTLILTILSQIPILAKLWFKPTPAVFLDSLIICGFGSFLFGWHVHEKAILMVIIPMTFVALNSHKHARIFFILSITGYYSLFPLLHEPRELPTKALVLSLYSFLAYHFLKCYSIPPQLVRFTWIETIYMTGLIPLFVYAEIAHLFSLHNTFEFLPLMATSVYCSVGIIYMWIRFYVLALS